MTMNVIGIISEKDILSSIFPDMKEIIESGAKADFEEMENDYTGVLDKTFADLMTRAVASRYADFACHINNVVAKISSYSSD
ncbi:MAG: hypothetical protein LC437_03845 [Thiohalomonas sp.]|nr:hypothetical protein [Thiohalomonas sp.]